MNLISIVVPVYNVRNFLTNCLESILNQTYKNLEILLVDDGSKDGSGELCDELSSRDPRIRVFHKDNGGLSDARNFGIEHSKGDYISFIDSDDIISPYYVEVLYNMLSNANAEISIGCFSHCYNEDELIFTKVDSFKKLDVNSAISSMLYQKEISVSACAKLFKRSCFDNIKFPIGKLYEDSAIMYLLLDKANVIAYSESKIYGYFHRLNTITTRTFDTKNFDSFYISKEIYNYYKNDQKLKKPATSYYVCSAMRIYLNCDDYFKYKDKIDQVESVIKRYGNSVVFDSNARIKSRLGVFLYLYFRPFLRYLYGKVDRWK